MPAIKSILIITERFPPDLGGVARSTERTAQAFASLGIRTEVLAWTKTLPAGTLETTQHPGQDNGSITVHRLGLFANLDFSLQYTQNVLEWLNEEQPFDLIWGHYIFPAGFMAVTFGEWVGLPSVVSARGNDLDRMMFPPGDFGRLTWTLQRAHAVTTVSQDLAKKVKLLVGNPKRLHVTPNVVDADFFSPAPSDPDLRARLGIKPEEAILGFCGELRQKKGLTFLLQALEEIQRQRPAALLIIGDIRPRERATLSEFAAEHPEAAARILSTGHLEDRTLIPPHLQLCDVVLQPSLWEGLPNATLEAMACERIVIASDAGGLSEVIEHSVSGFVIPRSQLNQLGTATLEVLELPSDQKASIGRAARQRVLKQFHPREESETLKVVLDDLANSTPSTSS